MVRRTLCLLMRSRGGAWPRAAAASTPASRQAKHCAQRDILIEQSVLGSLHSATKQKYVQKHSRVCTQVGYAMYWGKGGSRQ